MLKWLLRQKTTIDLEFTSNMQPQIEPDLIDKANIRVKLAFINSILYEKKAANVRLQTVTRINYASKRRQFIRIQQKIVTLTP